MSIENESWKTGDPIETESQVPSFQNAKLYELLKETLGTTQLVLKELSKLRPTGLEMLPKVEFLHAKKEESQRMI